ncbi:unnamed protein product [Rhizophagus irregularis]|nr:unnamed protein product [Rhizophagus irregularis]
MSQVNQQNQPNRPRAAQVQAAQAQANLPTQHQTIAPAVRPGGPSHNIYRMQAASRQPNTSRRIRRRRYRDAGANLMVFSGELRSIKNKSEKSHFIHCGISFFNIIIHFINV